jgi:hypothetical protein
MQTLEGAVMAFVLLLLPVGGGRIAIEDTAPQRSKSMHSTEFTLLEWAPGPIPIASAQRIERCQERPQLCRRDEHAVPELLKATAPTGGVTARFSQVDRILKRPVHGLDGGANVCLIRHPLSGVSEFLKLAVV